MEGELDSWSDHMQGLLVPSATRDEAVNGGKVDNLELLELRKT